MILIHQIRRIYVPSVVNTHQRLETLAPTQQPQEPQQHLFVSWRLEYRLRIQMENIHQTARNLEMRNLG